MRTGTTFSAGARTFVASLAAGLVFFAACGPKTPATSSPAPSAQPAPAQAPPPAARPATPPPAVTAPPATPPAAASGGRRRGLRPVRLRARPVADADEAALRPVLPRRRPSRFRP